MLTAPAQSTLRAACALGIVLFATNVLAGPLAPPSGPIVPTSKSLVEVEPRTAINATNTPGDANSVFRITQAGSYYLQQNVTVPAGFYGIEIAADNVTIDLNGFLIITAFFNGDGALRTDANTKVRVRNGLIEGPFTQTAVLCLGAAVIEDVVLESGNISVSGTATIRRCRVSSDALRAISLDTSTGIGSLIEDCQVTATAASTSGIACNQVGSTIRGCVVVSTAASSTATGIIAVQGAVLGGMVITDCNIRGPFLAGINCGAGITITDCTVQSATTGILSGESCLIEHNRFVSCSNGINLAGGGSSTVIRNTLRGCTTPFVGAAGDDVAPSGTAAASTNPHANLVN